MSAKLVEMTQRMPKSSSAQGACSRDRPATEILFRDDDLRAPVGRLVQHEIRVLGAVLAVAHLGEQALTKAGAGNRLEVLLRDDHVRVDVHDLQGRGDAGQCGEFFHGLPVAKRRGWRKRSGEGAIRGSNFVADGGAHEIIKPHKPDQAEADLERAADRRLELENAAERPAGCPGGADKLGADRNRHGDEG